MTSDSDERPGSAALPEKWIIPVRLAAYLALAVSCGYIYWSSRELEMTHYMIFLAIAAACAMALLDCRMSADHWEKKRIEEKKLAKDASDDDD